MTVHIRPARRGATARRWTTGVSLAALLLIPGSAASATPGTGVSGTVLTEGRSGTTVKAVNRGPTDVTVREITIEPGGTTGWHHHTGPLIAVLKSGTLTRTLADCSVEVSRAGDSFVEPPGRHRPHTGRNLGTEPVVLYVTYVLPAGDPLAVDAPDPGCGA
ncbi:cupin domain-containing protein [Streptomyces albus]|uniref:cupin domain-containing protein n=1 Tax=Streptomyces albus TaxID=1888 RepID=UPI00099D440D|nr:cupin domain-containing protein [Streptomyces albus]